MLLGSTFNEQQPILSLKLHFRVNNVLHLLHDQNNLNGHVIADRSLLLIDRAQGSNRTNDNPTSSSWHGELLSVFVRTTPTNHGPGGGSKEADWAEAHEEEKGGTSSYDRNPGTLSRW
jgi:hypothetical protein